MRRRSWFCSCNAAREQTSSSSSLLPWPHSWTRLCVYSTEMCHVYSLQRWKHLHMSLSKLFEGWWPVKLIFGGELGGVNSSERQLCSELNANVNEVQRIHRPVDHDCKEIFQFVIVAQSYTTSSCSTSANPEELMVGCGAGEQFVHP